MSNFGSLVLAIDTTSRIGAVALSINGQVVASVESSGESSQSSVLWVDMESSLANVGKTISDVTLFAVVRGPGAFTGVRVGLAAAAGLARATGVPVVGATSLELTAMAAGPSPCTWVLLNAYRDEVYAQPFAVDHVLNADPLADARACTALALEGAIGGDCVRFTGSGAEGYVGVLDEMAARNGTKIVRGPGEGWHMVDAPVALASTLARSAARIAAERGHGSSVEPCYIRRSEAEVNLERARSSSPEASRIG